MESKIPWHSLLEQFTCKDTDENKSLFIFDQNYNKLCASGKFRIGEIDAANIMLCLSSSWKGPVAIEVAADNFMCIVVGDFLLGKGDILNRDRYVNNIASAEGENHQNFVKDKVVLAATLVDGLLIILIGPASTNGSLLECLEEIKDTVLLKT